MFLEISKAIILGVIEGITEFLPISSTGHLILVNNWLRFSPSFTVLFDVVIQLGAIMAVVLVFWRKLWPFGKDAAQYMATRILWYKIIIAVLPALVLGALFGGMIEEKLFNPITVAVALMVGGFVLIFFEKKDKNVSELSDINIVSYRNAFLIGVFQCLAMVPGTSRSAVTIISAMLLGVGRVAAVEFSFFLAIPTMVAASGYSLLIGRGARYFPYELPREYSPDEVSHLFGRGIEFDKDRRKFDNSPFERGRALETFVYHFVKTGMFLENLQRDQ
jgi:undecaprenyl-diphosphatase